MLPLSQQDLGDPLPLDQRLDCFLRDSLPCLLVPSPLHLDLLLIHLVVLHPLHRLRDHQYLEILVLQIPHPHKVQVILVAPHPPLLPLLNLVDLINSLPHILTLAITRKFARLFRVMEDHHPLPKLHRLVNHPHSPHQ